MYLWGIYDYKDYVSEDDDNYCYDVGGIWGNWCYDWYYLLWIDFFEFIGNDVLGIFKLGWLV